MGKSRLEAFSDGVIAIIITIMVLELKVPHGADIQHLKELAPVFFSYVLSFLYVGIYWNNHHHLIHTVRRVSGGILWGNLHLLFWLSLVPFTTGWMGENEFAPWPVFIYAFNMLMAGVAYTILSLSIKSVHGEASAIAKAMGKDWKGKASIAGYLAAMATAHWQPLAAMVITVAVALMWLIPDKRIERALAEEKV